MRAVVGLGIMSELGQAVAAEALENADNTGEHRTEEHSTELPTAPPEAQAAEEADAVPTLDSETAPAPQDVTIEETTAEETAPAANAAPIDEEDALAGLPEQPTVDLTAQVRLYRRDDRLILALPADVTPTQDNASAFTWTDLQHQLKHRLHSGEPFWQAGMLVEMIVPDRQLDADQLQEIAETLREAQLHLWRVETTSRQTAIAAATAGYSVEQPTPLPQESPVSTTTASTTTASTTTVSTTTVSTIQAEPLYLQTTLRSGIEISHPGSVIVYGDTNPGSSIVAQGDILVWGRLRGVAHAGAKGNTNACIMALQIEPPAQLRIADYRARAPKPLDQAYPEVAYVADRIIRIAHANEFSRTEFPGY